MTNHEAFVPEALVDLEVSWGGTSVLANRRALEADLALGVGSISASMKSFSFYDFHYRPPTHFIISKSLKR